MLQPRPEIEYCGCRTCRSDAAYVVPCEREATLAFNKEVVENTIGFSIIYTEPEVNRMKQEAME